jgi:antitoxin component YwqK of YwqJK toxin-antitoxin module
MLCQLAIQIDVLSVPAIRLKQSKLFCDVISHYGCNIVVTFPSQYDDVSQHYINYLTDVQEQLIEQKLKRCFELCHYLSDDNLFSCLIEQLLQSWSSNNHIINKLHDELQRRIYLQIPFVYVPEHCQDNEVFFKQWLTNNNNKHIIVDDKYSHFSRYHGTDDGRWFEFYCHYKEVDGNYSFYGAGREWLLNPETNTLTLMSNHNYNKLEKKHGRQREWNINGVLINDCHYDNGVLHGICKQYYPSGQLEHQYQYYNGKRHGTWTKYFPLNNDNNIENTEEFTSGETQLWLEYHFNHGEEVGIFREWYSEQETGGVRQLKYEHNFSTINDEEVRHKQWNRDAQLVHQLTSSDINSTSSSCLVHREFIRLDVEDDLRYHLV